MLFYADKITDSMRLAMEETERRRTLQQEYNEIHAIEPRAVVRPIEGHLVTEAPDGAAVADKPPAVSVEADLDKQVRRLEKEMLDAAKNLEFEKAAELRDAIAYLKKRELGIAS